ncbi:MAG: serine/threonine protein kinase, partial [Lentisphaeraceae bacterium]|nr:serine/threonine protein kinase [Lentisphaeraceae bacterium]
MNLPDKNLDKKKKFISSFYDEAFTLQDKSQQSTSTDRYEILAVVNEGASKKILKVEDSLTRRVLAMATLKDTSPLQLELFEREARLTASLQHPHILPVYDIGHHETYGPYFTTKLIQGMSLRQLLKNLNKGNSQLSVNQRLEIFIKVCDALSYVHSRGVLHLDLKPENIHISDYGEVLVLDWGLAKIQDSLVTDEFIDSYSFDSVEQKYTTLCGTVKGTPGYLAPEQCTKNGVKSSLTDIYSLGALLYELITLKPLIVGDTQTLLAKTARGDLNINSSLLTPGLEAVVRRAVAFCGEQRYQQVSALSSDIQTYLQGFAPQAEQAGVLRELRLFIRRHQRVFSISLFFIICLIASTIFYISNISRSKTKIQNTLSQLHESQRRFFHEQKQKLNFQIAAQPKLIEDLKQSLSLLDWETSLTKAKELNDISSSKENQDLLATLYFIQGHEEPSLRQINMPASEWTSLLREVVNSDFRDEAIFNELNSGESSKKLLLLSH